MRKSNEDEDALHATITFVAPPVPAAACVRTLRRTVTGGLPSTTALECLVVHAKMRLVVFVHLVMM